MSGFLVNPGGTIQTGDIDDGAVTTAKINNAAVTAAKASIATQGEAEAGTDTTKLVTPLRVAEAIAALSSAKIAQVVSVFDGATASGTGTIPDDDTIPQNTEGTEFLTLAITPTNASSTLRIDYLLNIVSSGSGSPIVALFVDATAGALNAARNTDNAANGQRQLHNTHFVSAGSTTLRTYKIRGGGHVAGTTRINGDISARKMGGVLASYIIITEILP
jgi:hypothetical protein